METADVTALTITTDEKQQIQELKNTLGLNYEIDLPLNYYISNNQLMLTINPQKGSSIEQHLCPFFVVKAKVQTDSGLKLHIKTVYGDIFMPVKDDLSGKIAYLSEVLQQHLCKNTIKALDYYLAEYIRLNNSVIPYIYGYSSTGWRGDALTTPLIERENTLWLKADLESMYQVKGSFGVEKELFRTVMQTEGAIAVLAAMSAPLLRKLGVANYTVHLSGLTGSGKTSLAQYVSSIYGNPEKLKNTWNGSIVALELLGSQHNDFPVWLDEIAAAGIGQKEAKKVMNYFFQTESGKGKGRGNKDVTLRENLTRHNVTFSTAEFDLNTIDNLSRERAAGVQKGAYRRVIQLIMTAASWNTATASYTEATINPFLEDFNENKVKLNYGYLGKVWCMWVERQIAVIQNLHKQIGNELGASGGMKQIYNVLLTVLHTPFCEGLLTPEIVSTVDADIKSRMSLSAMEIEGIKDIASEFIAKLQDFVHINNNKFLESDTENKYRNGLIGEVSGYWNSELKVSIDKDVFLLRTTLSDICKLYGFVEAQVLAALDEKGLLEKDKDRDKGRLGKTHRFNGKSTKGYKVLNVF